MDNSDNESVDSQSDDPLKHAGIYTAEEATRITKEKLTRLQTLYIEQIHRLQHVLRERRRNYLREQRAERDYHCSIFDQVKQTPRERMLYEQLKGLNRYHRKHGVEAILQRKYLEKRAKATEGLQQKPPSLPKCAYTEGGVKCGERTLPCCKHCRKHILEDKKQVLFRACGIEKSGVVCQEPLAGLFENVTCPLHMELPAQRSFNKRKYESESEGESEVSGMEPPGVVVVAGAEKSSAKAANETNAATAHDNTQEDKKTVKVEPKVGGDGTVDAKTPLKAENNKRKVIKTEPVTPVPRVRNTRSSRAAMAMQEDASAEQPAPEQQAAEGELKKEQTEAKENENNVTSAAAATVDQTDDGIVDLEESLLPVSIIPNKKQKPDEATVAEQVSEMDRMDTSTEAAESAKEAMEMETTDERQAEPSTVPDQSKEGAESDNKEEEKTAETEEATEESSVAAEKEEPNTTTTITATENSQPKDADDTATTASVEESASTAPKESDDRTDQTPKAQPKPQPSPLTARQRKLRLATDRKESAAKGTNETATATATDEMSGTSDEEKAKKAKAGKAEPSSGSTSSSSAAGGSGSEQKSRRQK
uniref:KAT8 regulatory NSL complex subunit 2 n=1 Tax=Anopheles quadriannulatus TaxID=34691 RepID=A0A182X4Q7_ANOQN